MGQLLEDVLTRRRENATQAANYEAQLREIISESLLVELVGRGISERDLELLRPRGAEDLSTKLTLSKPSGQLTLSISLQADHISEKGLEIIHFFFHSLKNASFDTRKTRVEYEGKTGKLDSYISQASIRGNSGFVNINDIVDTLNSAFRSPKSRIDISSLPKAPKQASL